MKKYLLLPVALAMLACTVACTTQKPSSSSSENPTTVKPPEALGTPVLSGLGAMSGYIPKGWVDTKKDQKYVLLDSLLDSIAIRTEDKTARLSVDLVLSYDTDYDEIAGTTEKDEQKPVNQIDNLVINDIHYHGTVYNNKLVLTSENLFKDYGVYTVTYTNKNGVSEKDEILENFLGNLESIDHMGTVLLKKDHAVYTAPKDDAKTDEIVKSGTGFDVYKGECVSGSEIFYEIGDHRYIKTSIGDKDAKFQSIAASLE